MLLLNGGRSFASNAEVCSDGEIKAESKDDTKLLLRSLPGSLSKSRDEVEVVIDEGSAPIEEEGGCGIN